VLLGDYTQTKEEPMALTKQLLQAVSQCFQTDLVALRTDIDTFLKGESMRSPNISLF
jgi:hypothetical protein